MALKLRLKMSTEPNFFGGEGSGRNPRILRVQGNDEGSLG
jgi:hypothetical protein